MTAFWMIGFIAVVLLVMVVGAAFLEETSAGRRAADRLIAWIVR